MKIKSENALFKLNSKSTSKKGWQCCFRKPFLLSPPSPKQCWVYRKWLECLTSTLHRREREGGNTSFLLVYCLYVLRVLARVVDLWQLTNSDGFYTVHLLKPGPPGQWKPVGWQNWNYWFRHFQCSQSIVQYKQWNLNLNLRFSGRGCSQISKENT